MKKLLALLILQILLLSSCSEPHPKLHIFCWGDYFAPGLVLEFEQAFGCEVIIDTYESNEAMYARLRAGADGYDLIAPSNYFVELMKDADLLRPFDLEKLPLLRHLDRSDPFAHTKPGLDYAVPYMASFAAMGYRADRLIAPQASWTLFGDPTLKSRMTLLNDLRETLGAALIQLGYSPNTAQAEEVNAAADLVIEWKKNIAKFESEQFKNGLATKEFLLVHGYAGDIFQLQQEDSDIELLIPREGTTFSVDFFVLAKNAKNLELAHAFVNYMYRPEVAARNMIYNGYSTFHLTANELLPEEYRAHPAFSPPKRLVQRSEVIQEMGAATKLYLQAWERVMSAD